MLASLFFIQIAQHVVIDGQIITEDAHTFFFDIGVGNGIAKHSIRLMLTQELMNDLDFLMDLLPPPISFILKHIGSKILGMTSHCGCKSCFRIFSFSILLVKNKKAQNKSNLKVYP